MTPENPLFSTSLNVVLGFLLLSSAGVIRYLYKELKSERDNRLEDLRSYQKEVLSLTRETTKKESILYKKIDGHAKAGVR